MRRLVTALSLVAAMLLADVAAAKLLSVRVVRANFRAGPSTRHEVLFTADHYFPVKVVERRDGWVKVVDFEHEEAWVAERLLSDSDSVIVKVKRGNVRAGPGLKHDVTTDVIYGEAFRLVERRGRWLRVATARRVLGWIRDDLTWGDEQR